MNYQSILENFPAALGNFGLKGEILYANPTLCQFLGFDSEELKNKSLLELTHHEDIELVIKEFEKIPKGKQKQHTISKRYIHKNGSIKWAKLFVTPVLNELNHVESFIGLVQDITEQQISNEKLSLQETVFRNMFMKNPQIMAIYNTDNLSFLEVNEAASKILGYSKEEMLSLKISDLFSNVDLKAFQKFNNRENNEFAIRREWKVNHKNGTELILEVNSQSIFYQGIKARHLMANDISERKKKDIALNESAEFIHHSQEIVQMGNWEKDYQTGNIKWSENFYRLLGLNPYDVQPSFENFMENVHPEDQDQIKRAIHLATQEKKEVNVDCRILKKDGTVGWLSNTVQSKFESDKLVKLTGINIDISKRKEIELKLERINKTTKILNDISFQFLNGKKSETNQIINQGLEQISSYLKIDRSYIYQLDTQNNNLANTHEWHNENVSSKTTNFQKLSLVDFPWLMDQLIKAKPITCQSLSRVPDILETEYQFLSSSNTVSFLLIPMYFEEKLKGFIGFETVREQREWDELSRNKLTQLADLISSELARREREDQLIKAKEKAEESAKLKTAFLAVISHEFRTPLNSIIGFSDVIQSLSKDDEIKKFSEFIEKSGYDMLELLEDLFDLSFAQGTNIKNSPVTTTCLDLYWRAKTGLEENLFKTGKQNQIKLVTTKHNQDLNRSIKIDTNKVLQILSILSKNAVKFTEKGAIEFTVKLFTGENQIQFLIRDTGIGFDANKKEIIFDYFRQVDESTTRPYEGLGIGLSIAKHLVSLLNGSIEAESKVGQGSTFTVTIPTEFTSPALTEVEKHTAETQENFQFLEGKFILVVDDDYFMHEIMRMFFKNSGVELQYAYNGKEAIQIVENCPPDLILMDLIMPEMDGFEATSQIKLASAEIPIVAITAHSILRERQKALEAGCDDIITKPIYRKVLHKVLSRFLEN